jgi:hypothetical protein
MLLAYVWSILTGNTILHGSESLALVVPLGLILFGFLLPKFGALLSASEKPFLIALVERTLGATNANVAPAPRAWDSMLA